MQNVSRRTLNTERLALRPSHGADAARAFDIRSDWEVTRTLSMATYPPVLHDIAAWFGGHEQEWQAGMAYRFAIDHQEQMIGLVDLDAVTEEEATLGYWIERPAWGQGFASEAAQAVLLFAFDELELKRIRAGHAADNGASGRVLSKLGFHVVEKVLRYSKPRGTDIEQWRYELALRP